jgi:hypothetical protein
MKIIITEEQYNKVLMENTFKDVISSLKLNSSIVFTFGAGVSAFMGPVERLLTKSNFNFTKEEIVLLIITSFALLINDSNKSKLLEEITSKGLIKAFKGVYEFVKNTTEIIKATIKNLLGVTYNLSEILGFAFLLNPIMKILVSLINDRNITVDNVNMLLSGIILSGLVFSIKSLLGKGKEYFSKNKEPLDNEINEGIITENFVRLSEKETKNLIDSLIEMGFDEEDAEYELNNLINYYDNLSNKLTLYRIVFSDSSDTIDTQYPGSHYSMNKKNLIDSHYSSLRDSSYGENPYLIQVVAEKQMIDFFESIKNNILYPNEEEITLKNKGFGVNILKIVPVF